MTTRTIASVGLALILAALATAAEARTHRQIEAGPAFDRHAVHTIGSEPVLTERAPRKVRTAVKQSRKKHQRHHRERMIAPSHLAAVAGHSPLVEKARAFIGRTAAELGLPRSLWCADFIAKIAPEAARKVGNPRWARDYAALPKTSAQVGAIVVLSRGRRGGHIGVVSGFDGRGNPIVISGNHGRKVGEGVYPRNRVIAWVVGDEKL